MNGDTTNIPVPSFDLPGMEAGLQGQSDFRGRCLEIQRTTAGTVAS
jgi:hypothetical protein